MLAAAAAALCLPAAGRGAPWGIIRRSGACGGQRWHAGIQPAAACGAPAQGSPGRCSRRGGREGGGAGLSAALVSTAPASPPGAGFQIRPSGSL